MYSTTTYPHRQTWWPTLGQRMRQWLHTLTPAPAHQVSLPPGDVYFLNAGAYHLRVQAGCVWLPAVGLFSAGEQVTVNVTAAGLAIHSYAQQAAVLQVRRAE